MPRPCKFAEAGKIRAWAIAHPKAANMLSGSSVESRYNNSDKLAIALACVGAALAIALVLIGILLDKPLTVLALLVLMAASLIYPVIHFVKTMPRRIAAFVGLVLIIGVIGTVVWTSQKRAETQQPFHGLEITGNSHNNVFKDVQIRNGDFKLSGNAHDNNFNGLSLDPQYDERMVANWKDQMSVDAGNPEKVKAHLKFMRDTLEARWKTLPEDQAREKLESFGRLERLFLDNISNPQVVRKLVMQVTWEK